MKWGLEQQIFAAVLLSKEWVYLEMLQNSDGICDVKHLFWYWQMDVYPKHVLKKHRLQLKGGLILDHCRQLNFIGKLRYKPSSLAPLILFGTLVVPSLGTNHSVDYVMFADQICWESLEGSEFLGMDVFPSNVGVDDENDDVDDDGASENEFFGVQKAAEALEDTWTLCI